MQIIAYLYDSYADAATVVRELEDSGVPHSEISLLANADAHGRHTGGTETVTGDHPLDPADRRDTGAEAGAKRGSVAGTVIGGGVGLLAGIGALAIPGIGPLVAAGWLVTALAGAGVGAAGGGIVGALTGAGINRDECVLAGDRHTGSGLGGRSISLNDLSVQNIGLFAEHAWNQQSDTEP